MFLFRPSQGSVDYEHSIKIKISNSISIAKRIESNLLTTKPNHDKMPTVQSLEKMNADLWSEIDYAMALQENGDKET